MTSSIAATERTRDRIMRTALALFLERGYLGASVRDIADANGVTVPALYYHFTNKDDLLAAIVQPMADDGEVLIERLESGSGRGRGRPAVPVAEALGGYLDVLAAHLDVFRFVSTDLAVRSQEMGLAPKSQCAMNDLIEKVKRIRYRGFALCRRDDAVKVESIACPMHLPQSDAPMAVGLLGDKLLENDRSAGELARTMQQLIARHVQKWNAAAV